MSIKINFLLFCLSLTPGLLPAQGPLLKIWDYRFGGLNSDILMSTKQTSDSGFVLTGFTTSMSAGGDITDSSRGSEDFWVVKINKSGVKEWARRYGGLNNDLVYDGLQTTDGGYIFAGCSFSNIGWEKSQNNWDPTLQTPDMWILKTDSLGIKQWDKRYGGTDGDAAVKIIRTNDGQYMVAGLSLSGLNGDKTQPSQGGSDIWIIKMDVNGNKIWDKRYGGSKNDEPWTIYQTNDNGYLLVGYSYSNAGGDKTQNNNDPSLNTPDYWIVKIDSVGNKQWDKTYGGNNYESASAALIRNNGDYIICGFSKSGISGDRTIANYDTSTGWNATHDYWIIRVDSTGLKTGEKVFGNTSYDECWNAVELGDGNFLFSGESYSPAGGDKSENNLGHEQVWLVKTDTNLNKIWDKTIFTPNLFYDDESASAFQSFDGCIIATCMTSGGIGGYKSQSNWDPGGTSSDYWIIKFCDTTQTTGLAYAPEQSDFRFFPNPFSEELVVECNPVTCNEQLTNKKSGVKIYDVYGRTVLSKPITNPSIKLNTSVFFNGIYFVSIFTCDKVFTKKIIKTN